MFCYLQRSLTLSPLGEVFVDAPWAPQIAAGIHSAAHLISRNQYNSINDIRESATRRGYFHSSRYHLSHHIPMPMEPHSLLNIRLIGFENLPLIVFRASIAFFNHPTLLHITNLERFDRDAIPRHATSDKEASDLRKIEIRQHSG